MLTADDVRVLDANSAWHGVPTSLLMQNAGRVVADEALAMRPKRVLVLAGLGNNGGDGAVAARLLSEAGVPVTVLYAGDPDDIQGADARVAHGRLDRRRVRVEAWRSEKRSRELLSDCDVVVDALLGIGVRGELREPTRSLVRLANASRRRILSVDLPTGLGARLQLRPETTVTFHDRKAGMTSANSGRIRVRDIGIPEAAQGEVGPGDLSVYFPRPAPESHKGENGRLLAVLGGPYTGAPLLASLGALRTGCDIVRLYAPTEAAQAAQAHLPDLIVHPGVEARRLVPDDVPSILPLLERCDAILVGSGLGTDRPTQAAVERLLAATRAKRVPTVLDADALDVAGRHPELLTRRPLLCTPHEGEYRKLTGEAAPRGDKAIDGVAAAARALHATILLKARHAVITDGRRTKRSRVHPAGLTAGGVGDVLAGSCAALVAKGLEPFRAAAAASFLVGAAGRRTREAWGYAARATDVAQEVGRVLRDWVPAHSG